MLDDDRAEVTEPDVVFEAHVDGETVRVVGFPEIEGTVGTVIGDVRTAVSVEGEPAGRYDPETGHVTVEATLSFDPHSLLASTSRVALRLASDARLADPKADGNPLNAGDDRVTLVSEGTFEDGSLDGGRLGLVIDCQIGQIDAV